MLNPAAPLKSAGLRVTRPRRLVLSLLAGWAGHHSADDIAEALARAGTPLSRTSVYNVVNDLAARGILMTTDVGPGRALYEYAERWHHHFVCRDCGRIEDVPCLRGREPCLSTERIAGSVDQAQIIFRGRCRRCLETLGPAGP